MALPIRPAAPVITTRGSGWTTLIRYPPCMPEPLEASRPTFKQPGLAGLQPPLQKIGYVTGLAVLTAPADNQRRRARRQLHAGETLPQPTWDGEHVIAAVLTDCDALIFTDVPAHFVGLHRLAAIKRCAQRVGSHAFGLGPCHELINEFLSLTRFTSGLSRSELCPPGGLLGTRHIWIVTFVTMHQIGRLRGDDRLANARPNPLNSIEFPLLFPDEGSKWPRPPP